MSSNGKALRENDRESNERWPELSAKYERWPPRRLTSIHPDSIARACDGTRRTSSTSGQYRTESTEIDSIVFSSGRIHGVVSAIVERA